MEKNQPFHFSSNTIETGCNLTFNIKILEQKVLIQSKPGQTC